MWEALQQHDRVSLVANVARHSADPNRVALTLGAETRTYAELVHRATVLAAGLSTSLGVGSGDRVALLCRNRIEYFEIELGVSHAGAVLVAMSWRYAPGEAVAVLSRSGASVAIVDPDFVPVLAAARDSGDLPDLRSVVVFGDAQGTEQRYDDLVRQGEAAGDWAPGHSSRLGDPHEIIFTSGTTGTPKGAVWTTGGLLWNALQQIADFGITGASSTFVSFDLNYIGGRHQFVWSVLLQGGAVHLKPSGGFDPSQVLSAVEQHEVTHLLLVPTMLGDVLDQLSSGPRRTDSLQMIMCGGAPVSESMLADAALLLPDVWTAHVYGLTEGGGTVTFTPRWATRAKPGSAGLPSLNAQLRIASQQAESGPGVIGEIEVLAPTLSAGYWAEPEATDQLFHDGWLRTGDLGYLDDDGFLFITGRCKELIISGAMNVFPAEIEAVLESHPAVRRAAVFGLPHPRWGEAVAAAVELGVEARPSEEELIEFCRQHLSGYKKPTRVWFVDQLPRTASGKLKKLELSSRYAADVVGHE
jgi:fatty-acyl-CoA synthase